MSEGGEMSAIDRPTVRLWYELCVMSDGATILRDILAKYVTCDGCSESSALLRESCVQFVNLD